MQDENEQQLEMMRNFGAIFGRTIAAFGAALATRVVINFFSYKSKPEAIIVSDVPAEVIVTDAVIVNTKSDSSMLTDVAVASAALWSWNRSFGTKWGSDLGEYVLNKTKEMPTDLSALNATAVDTVGGRIMLHVAEKAIDTAIHSLKAPATANSASARPTA